MRAFLAIDVSSKDVLDKIESLQRRFMELGCDLRVVKRENIHFTVKFLGEITDYQANMVIDAIKDLKIKKAKIRYVGLGAFPNQFNPRVIWIGVDNDSKFRLNDIYQQVFSKISHMGLGDTKPFQPHITIFRVKSGKNRSALTKALKECANEEFGEEIAYELKLKKSTLTPSGPIYEDVFKLKFTD
jgi:2'-5' RNA ligase